MLNYLARHPWGRIALIPVLIGCGAWSWLADNLLSRNPTRPVMQQACWGWLSKAMEPHWARLADPKSDDYGSAFHSLKNVLTEWCRTDSERAGKVMSFLIVAMLVFGFTATLSALVFQ